MKILSFYVRLFFIAVSILLGNRLGEELRFILTGRREHQLRFTQTTPEGETLVAVNPLMSNFLPGLVAAALLGRPRWWNAFLGGLAASALMGDRYEKDLLGMLRRSSMEG
jgi:hypothetical protein